MAKSHHLHEAVLKPAIAAAESQVFHELGGAHFSDICEHGRRSYFNWCMTILSTVRHVSPTFRDVFMSAEQESNCCSPAAYSDSIIDPTLYVSPCRCFPLNAPFPRTNLSKTACRAQRYNSFRIIGR